MLDKNQLYVNPSEIEDADCRVSAEDKALNGAFDGLATTDISFDFLPTCGLNLKGIGRANQKRAVRVESKKDHPNGMLTERQQTVFDWLNDNLELPVYAEAYKGALDMLDKKASGYITFVSHTSRDLMNGLASAVKGIKREQVQYVQLVDEFKDDWKNEWGGEGFDTTEDNDGNGYLIPNEICKNIKKLVDEHTAGRLRSEDTNSSFFTTFLDYPDKESIPDDLSQEWRSARRWFVKHAHLREDEFETQAPDEVERHFQNLDNLLYAAAGSEFEQLRSLHEILEETNQ